MVAAASQAGGQELSEEILSSGDLRQHGGYPQSALAAKNQQGFLSKVVYFWLSAIWSTIGRT